MEVVVLIWVVVMMGMAVVCLGCVGMCLKIYTEMMKEHTIRKRYEMQGEIMRKN